MKSSPFAPGLAIVVLSLEAGCGRSEEETSSEVLQILAAHRSPDTDPAGEWIGTDERGAWLLHVRMKRPGLWTLSSQPPPASAASQQTSPLPPEVISGDLSNGILTLESPLVGSMRVHVCRFAGEETLVPEESVRFGSGNQEPSGTFFKRMRQRKDFKRLEQFGECSRAPTVDALPAGIWEGVDCPEWAWLKVLPTGATGAFVVRRSQLLGGITTPAHTFAGASWEGDVLTLDTPLFGNSTWCVRHLAGEDWLVPQAEIRAEGGRDLAIREMRFRLANRVTSPHVEPWQLMDGEGLEPLREY